MAGTSFPNQSKSAELPSRQNVAARQPSGGKINKNSFCANKVLEFQSRNMEEKGKSKK